ncbi:MAG: secretin N-terminal domain-containing protein [Wenzhouxiangella sp.]|nr:secretin N-terminal domain-containing protein [Wenzhouxiangella sp.]
MFILRLMTRSLLLMLTGTVLLASVVKAEESTEGHVLNFNDADIRSLIQAVAEMTGRNIIIDPQVSGRITVASTQPLVGDEIWAVFQSILQVHGFTAVSDENVTRILPDVNARQDGRVPVDGMGLNGDDPVTRLLKLEHVRASEASQLLRSLLPQSAYMAHHEPSNTLIIADRAANIRRIETIVRRLDAANDQEVEVIALSHADASEVVRMLNRLYADSGSETALADERTNTVILAGDPSRRLRLRTLISHLDTPLESDGSTQVLRLRYATADTLVPVLEGLLELDGEEGQRVRIQAHQDTNALVISAPPALFRSIESVINQLDIRRDQVLVEAIIAEVAVDTSRELGVQWQAFSSGDSGLFGGTNFQGGGNNILNLSAAAGQVAEDGNLFLPGRGMNLGYVRGRSSLLGIELLEIGALARALSQDANTNVLSTPSIVTMDNHEASINVGQEVPFLSGSFSTQGIATGDGQVNPFQTINREEIGVKLNVTPHINEGDMILLKIEQEVSTLAPSGGAVDLITNKRTLSTRVMVPDGAMLVLGGLTSDDLQEQMESVPGLGRIPLLGELFRYRSTSTVKRDLMIFIRPRILHDDQVGDDLTRSNYARIRGRQIEQREQRRGLTRPEEMPLLPELADFLHSPPDER